MRGLVLQALLSDKEHGGTIGAARPALSRLERGKSVAAAVALGGLVAGTAGQGMADALGGNGWRQAASSQSRACQRSMAGKDASGILASLA